MHNRIAGYVSAVETRNIVSRHELRKWDEATAWIPVPQYPEPCLSVFGVEHIPPRKFLRPTLFNPFGEVQREPEGWWHCHREGVRTLPKLPLHNHGLAWSLNVRNGSKTDIAINRTFSLAPTLHHSHPMPSPSRSRCCPNPGSPRLTGAAPAARASEQFANTPPLSLNRPPAAFPVGLEDVPRWQWYSPVFRLLWHPSALSPPECATAC